MEAVETPAQPTGEPRKCARPGCETIFEPRGPQKFCSIPCRDLAANVRIATRAGLMPSLETEPALEASKSEPLREQFQAKIRDMVKAAVRTELPELVRVEVEKALRGLLDI